MQALPFIMMAGSAMQGIGQMQQMSYQSAVAENNAKIAQHNTETEKFAADQDMMDRDIQAGAQIGELISSMGASGLSGNTGSMLLRRNSLSDMAARDRERLAQKRDVNVENGLREVESYRSEAKSLKSAKSMVGLSTILNMGTSYLSGSKMVRDYKTSGASMTAPSIARGR
jgi:hypothetical protein